jgi:hypothetical protein
MQFSLSSAYEILERTPGVYKVLLSGLSPAWTHCNEGGESWSAYDVVGHLIHGEKTDWMIRVEIILGNSADKTFEPFDRFAQIQDSKGKSLEELLDEFAKLRQANLQKLKALQLNEDDLDRKGMHPDLGEVSLRQLLSTWTIHDLGHLNQVSRVMVKQYKEEVGPWKAYSRILNPTS